MIGKVQFSLRFLMLEVACVCVALAQIRAASLLPEELWPAAFLLAVSGIGFGGAAIGGVFGKMIAGAMLTVLISVPAYLALFTAMVLMTHG